jgi:sporulation protein YlmC with PRC-barrel domain
MTIFVVRDVLDKKLFDEDDEEMGRVDGLVMQFGERTQPRITHIEIGGATLGARIHPSIARLSKWLAGRWGPKRRRVVRIPWSKVEHLGKNIKLAVEAKDTGAIDWEIWLARHFIERIPGGGHEEVEEKSGG